MRKGERSSRVDYESNSASHAASLSTSSVDHSESSVDGQRRVNVFGVGIDCIGVKQLYARVRSLLRTHEKHLVTYVNVHTLNTACHDCALRAAYAMSSITYCDGAGVVMGARLLRQYLPERMTGASFIHEFCSQWQRDGVRVFFLGGLPGVAARACERLKELYPSLQIAGQSCGYFARGSQEEEAVLSRVSEAHPDILFVGLGTPLQERWVLANWSRLDAHIIWTIGALVDYLSGKTPRCPRWMQRHSMEWVYRLVIEPRRMFGRYVFGNPLFLLRVLRERCKR